MQPDSCAERDTEQVLWEIETVAVGLLAEKNFWKQE